MKNDNYNGANAPEKEKICVLAVCEQPYDFTDKDGKHHEGISYKAVIAYYPAGKKNPRTVEICKIDPKCLDKILGCRGQYFDGVCLFDKYGRFFGIG